MHEVSKPNGFYKSLYRCILSPGEDPLNSDARPLWGQMHSGKGRHGVAARYSGSWFDLNEQLNYL
jgi:hypothetical protein